MIRNGAVWWWIRHKANKWCTVSHGTHHFVSFCWLRRQSKYNISVHVRFLHLLPLTSRMVGPHQRETLGGRRSTIPEYTPDSAKPTWTWCLHCQIKINFSQLAIKAQHAVVSNYALVPPPVSDLLCSSWHCWCYALVNPLFFSLEKAFFNLFIMFCPYYLYGNRRHNK